ncbi:MAG TPA: transcription elongation factor GreA [Candidatus Kapabacteria bacterium]|nr:transcription elongation factor GreA [Candidatus Kapabacteria bacterium]
MQECLLLLFEASISDDAGLEAQMDQGKIYMTRQRLTELEEEVKRLRFHGRRDIAQRIAEARAQGDLSENAEYDAAREEQGLLELRIRKMEGVLARSAVIDESNISTDKVGIMTRVTVMNAKTKKKNEYQIVSAEEADFEGGRISTSSPIGKALLNKKVGEEVQVNVPAGTLELKIISIGK